MVERGKQVEGGGLGLGLGAGPKTFAPTSRSLTLRHLIGIHFAMLLLSELKNCLELEKTGKLTHARPDNQGANPMLPNDDNLIGIEEEVN